MTAPLDLDAIRARVERATEGPWAWHSYMKTGRTLATPGPTFEMSLGGHTVHAATHELNVLKTTDDWPPNDADAEFIAHAREDVPALLDEVENLRAQLEATRAQRALDVQDYYAEVDARSTLEAERDRWKQAYEMADPLLTDRDRLAATVDRVRALADEMNAASDREAELADRFAGYHAGARSARMESEARLRAAIEGTDS